MVRACLGWAGEDVVPQVRRTVDGVPLLVEEILASAGVLSRSPHRPRAPG
jgi:hypothetical protein